MQIAQRNGNMIRRNRSDVIVDLRQEVHSPLHVRSVLRGPDPPGGRRRIGNSRRDSGKGTCMNRPRPTGAADCATKVLVVVASRRSARSAVDSKPWARAFRSRRIQVSGAGGTALVFKVPPQSKGGLHSGDNEKSRACGRLLQQSRNFCEDLGGERIRHALYLPEGAASIRARCYLIAKQDKGGAGQFEACWIAFCPSILPCMSKARLRPV